MASAMIVPMACDRADGLVTVGRNHAHLRHHVA
jgi:hypothetical protein